MRNSWVQALQTGRQPARPVTIRGSGALLWWLLCRQCSRIQPIPRMQGSATEEIIRVTDMVMSTEPIAVGKRNDRGSACLTVAIRLNWPTGRWIVRCQQDR